MPEFCIVPQVDSSSNATTQKMINLLLLNKYLSLQTTYREDECSCWIAGEWSCSWDQSHSYVMNQFIWQEWRTDHGQHQSVTCITSYPLREAETSLRWQQWRKHSGSFDTFTLPCKESFLWLKMCLVQTQKQYYFRQISTLGWVWKMLKVIYCVMALTMIVTPRLNPPPPHLTPVQAPHPRPNAQATSSRKQKLKLPIYTLHYKLLLCVKLNKW